MSKNKNIKPLWILAIFFVVFAFCLDTFLRAINQYCKDMDRHEYLENIKIKRNIQSAQEKRPELAEPAGEKSILKSTKTRQI